MRGAFPGSILGYPHLWKLPRIAGSCSYCLCLIEAGAVQVVPKS